MENLGYQTISCQISGNCFEPPIDPNCVPVYYEWHWPSPLHIGWWSLVLKGVVKKYIVKERTVLYKMILCDCTRISHIKAENIKTMNTHLITVSISSKEVEIPRSLPDIVKERTVLYKMILCDCTRISHIKAENIKTMNTHLITVSISSKEVEIPRSLPDNGNFFVCSGGRFIQSLLSSHIFKKMATSLHRQSPSLQRPVNKRKERS